MDDFYLGHNELWAIFASGISLMIAGSISISLGGRTGSGVTADMDPPSRIWTPLNNCYFKLCFLLTQ